MTEDDEHDTEVTLHARDHPAAPVDSWTHLGWLDEDELTENFPPGHIVRTDGAGGFADYTVASVQYASDAQLIERAPELLAAVRDLMNVGGEPDPSELPEWERLEAIVDELSGGDEP